MTEPINTPKWLFTPGAPLPADQEKPSPKPKRGRGYPRYSPPDGRDRARRETTEVLQLHAVTLNDERGRSDLTTEDAQNDLNWRNKIFRSYLPKTRSTTKRKQGEQSEGRRTTTSQ